MQENGENQKHNFKSQCIDRTMKSVFKNLLSRTIHSVCRLTTLQMVLKSWYLSEIYDKKKTYINFSVLLYCPELLLHNRDLFLKIVF